MSEIVEYEIEDHSNFQLNGVQKCCRGMTCRAPTFCYTQLRIAILCWLPIALSRCYANTIRHSARDHIPAYLESSNLANTPFYKEQGFDLLSKIQARHRADLSNSALSTNYDYRVGK